MLFFRLFKEDNRELLEKVKSKKMLIFLFHDDSVQ